MRKVREWAQPRWWLAADPLECASPVLVDALSAAGLSLDALLEHAAVSQKGTPGAMRVHPLRREGGSVQLMDAAGILKCCEIQRRENCLELFMTLGERAFVSTNRNLAKVTIKMKVPETLRVAARGRPLHELVEHPMLQRADYTVRRICDYGRMGFTFITFNAPMIKIDRDVAGRLDTRAERG